MKCSQCNNTDIIHNVRVLDRVGDDSKSDLALETQIVPHALFINDTVSIPLSANVCGNCGTVIFSVNDPKNLAVLREAAEGYEDVTGSEGEDPDSAPGFGSFLGEKGSQEESESESDSESESESES